MSAGPAQHTSLGRPPADLIAGAWRPLPAGPGPIASRNPARPAETIWSAGPELGHVGEAVRAARKAFEVWSRWPFERRAAVLRRFEALCGQRQAQITAVIRDEIGKPTWDSAGEAGLLGAKVQITLDDSPTGAMTRVREAVLPLSPTRQGRWWFRPHGVMAVLGPFNFPMHLPNGHIIPALAMGNTVVFKPSDKAPACGQLLAELYHEALELEGAPPGVVNLVQGQAQAAQALVNHEEIDGVLFTGSWPVGRSILQANLDRPGRLMALEMGGNNPAIVMPDADLAQAAAEIVRCAFVTAGQRCTCTRRAIVHKAVAPRVLPALIEAAKALRIDDPSSGEAVFMGPLISEGAREGVLKAQQGIIARGAEVLLESKKLDRPGGGWFLSPGIVRVQAFTFQGDEEIFGPFLQVSVVSSLREAIEQANATNYGLAASVFTHDAKVIEECTASLRAGCINVNTGTAGASSKLPFGGLGRSGNHRPAGAFSLDYCAYPVAGMFESSSQATPAPGMRFDPAWIR